MNTKFFKVENAEHNAGLVSEYFEINKDCIEVRRVSFKDEKLIFVSCHPFSSIYRDKLLGANLSDCFDSSGSLYEYLDWIEISSELFKSKWNFALSMYNQRWNYMKSKLVINNKVIGWVVQYHPLGTIVGSDAFMGFSGITSDLQDRNLLASCYYDLEIEILSFIDCDQMVKIKIHKILGKVSEEIAISRWKNFLPEKVN